MNERIKIFVVVCSLLLLVVGVAACSRKPTGQELLQEMEKTIEDINDVQFTVQFQVATAKGQVRGVIDFWGSRPDMAWAEISSDTPSVGGIVTGVNEEGAWVYSTYLDTLYVAKDYPTSPHLLDQPELRRISKVLKKAWAEGDANVAARNLGREKINGQQAYKVEVKFTETAELENVVLWLWIDQDSFLPHQLELSITEGEFTGKGLITRQGDVAIDAGVDVAQFVLTGPSTDYAVVDLTQEVDFPALLERVSPGNE